MAAAICLIGVTQAHAAPPPQVSECSSCHGNDGLGSASAGYPALAGLSSAYIQEQLYDFKHGTRVNAIMTSLATPLKPADRKALADYYAALPVPVQLEPTILPTGIGADIADHGHWRGSLANGVPSCASCHGAGGIGVGADFPRIAGQPQAYIAAQLNDWHNGTRKNGPLGLMTAVAGKLSPDEINALAAYYAALPANPAPEAKQ